LPKKYWTDKKIPGKTTAWSLMSGFSEQSLYDNGEVRETLDILKEKGYTFEKDGAVWF